MGPAPLLSLRAITKRFPGVTANDGVDLDVHRGEVHALVGENGAGKSTLMKILYGFYRADAGEIRARGAAGGDPLAARRAPARHRPRVPGLRPDPRPQRGREHRAVPARPPVGARPARRRRAHPVDVGAVRLRRRPVARPSGACRSASARRWRCSSSCSPTRGSSSWTSPPGAWRRTRSTALFASFDQLRRDGYAIVFIAHKLREVLACADRITVMRRGRVAGTLSRARGLGGGARVADVRGRARRAGGAPRARGWRRRRPCWRSTGVGHARRGARDGAGRRRSDRPAGGDRRRRRRLRQRAARAGRRDPRRRAVRARRQASPRARRRRRGPSPGSGRAASRSSPRTPSRWRRCRP